MKLVLIFAGLLLSLNSPGQLWLHGRIAPDSFTYVSVKMDTLENSVAYSAAYNIFNSQSKSILSKYDKNNNRSWTLRMTHRDVMTPDFRRYTGILSHAIDGNGNIYVISTPIATLNGTSYPADTALSFMKFNPDGKVIWTKKISFVSYGIQIISDQADHLYICGQTYKSHVRVTDSLYGPVPGTTNIFLSRLDTSGSVKWTRFLSAQWSVPATTGSPNFRNFIMPHIATNKNGDLLVTGTYIDTINIAGVRHTASPVSTTMKRASFAALFDKTGSVIYRKHIPTYYPADAMKSNMLFDDRKAVYIATNYDTTVVHQFTTGQYFVDSVNILNASGDLVRAFKLKFNDSTKFDVTNITRKDTGSGFYLAGTFHLSYIMGTSTGLTRYHLRSYDTTGALTWTKSLPYLPQTHNSYAFDMAVRRNIFAAVGYLYMQNTTMIVMGADTVRLSPTYNNGYNSIFGLLTDKGNIVSGTAYYDLNSNNQFDPNEKPAIYVEIKNGSQGRTFTNGEGRYSYSIGPGNYTDSIRTPLYYLSSPLSYSYSFAGMDSSVSDRDFRLNPAAAVYDLAVNLIPRSNASFSSLSYLQINYKNLGTTTVNATVRLRPSALATYVSSTLPTAYVSPDSIGWQLNGLMPGESGSINVTLKYSTAPLNTVIRSFVNVDPIIIDSNKLNNADTLTQPLRGAWDPNNKLCNPVDTLNKTKMAEGKEWIEYVINFQNTGTDTARYVAIMDTLSPLLDHTSIEILGATHRMTPTLEDNRLMFEFTGIDLPDSNVNKEGSMGAVYFRIKPKQSLVVGDTIKNNASIYFDFNDAVVTNRTANYLKQNIVTSLPVISRASRQLQVFPNPVRSSELQFRIDVPPALYTVRVVDMNGRVVHSSGLRINTQTQKLPGIGIPPGMYILEISNSIHRLSSVFLKME